MKFTSSILPVLLLSILLTSCNKNKAKVNVSANDTLITLKLFQTEVYLTAKGSPNKITQQEPVKFQDLSQPVENFPNIIVDYKKTFQSLEGIGGAMTDAAAETFYKLPSEKQEEIMTAYYDAQKGIGYSFGRTHINSCDFSSESYAYVTDPRDTALSSFSIEHDKKFRIPFIKRALEKAGNQIKIFASPWSPPAYMKTNNNMLQGGKLKPEYAKSWALYYTKFIEAYKSEGIPIWGLTVQNEPMAVQTWESCVYTGEDERDFVRHHLGPQLEKSGLFPGIKLMIWDHNRDMMYQRAKAVYDDPEAAKYVWGTSFHWYMGDHFDNVKIVHEAFPDKALVFSEGCGYPFSWENVKDWKWGEIYATSIIQDFNNFTSAWTDWNLLLDETGGPNHVNNFCLAPIIGDTKKGEVYYMSSYYYIGHFSKFIRPGAKRVACTSMSDNLLATAFLNPDGKVAVVVLNKTDNAINFNIWIDKKAAKISTPAHSIVTCVVK